MPFIDSFLNDRKGGEFEESLRVICQKMNVNCNNSYYDCEKEASCGAENEEKKFAVNLNNRFLWEVLILSAFLSSVSMYYASAVLRARGSWATRLKRSLAMSRTASTAAIAPSAALTAPSSPLCKRC